MGIIEDLYNKLKERQEQVDKLLETMQTTINNINIAMIHSDKVMSDIQKTLAITNATVVDIQITIEILRRDYEDLKKKIEKKPWWAWW